MEFNVSKCYCMHITHKKTPLATSYSLNGHDLDNFISHTYLGVHINSNLTWAQHIGKVEVYIIQREFRPHTVRRNLHSCSPRVKEAAYNTVVLPRLEHCASILDPFHTKDINQLEAVQRRADFFQTDTLRPIVSLQSCQLWAGNVLRSAKWLHAYPYFTTIHHRAAINSDHLNQNPNKMTGVQTRSTKSISFIRVPANRIATNTRSYRKLQQNGTSSQLL